MSLHVRFGIIGAILGLLVGIVGGIAAGVPFGIVLLRCLLSVVVAGALGFVISFLIQQFLPELIPESANSDPNTEDTAPGQRVDITLSEDEAEAGDQAAPLRQEYGQAKEDSLFTDESVSDDDAGIMEEVSEDRRTESYTGGKSTGSGFDEDAFYQGVEHLPDIGGFSEQFKQSDMDEASGDRVESAGPSFEGGSGAGQSAAGSNLNPALIAEAIRTAMKKEER